MEDDVLSKIVEVEKEIHERVEAENQKARGWLEKVRREAETELIRVEQEVNRSFHNVLEDARQTAEQKAEDILNDAHAIAERIDNISDKILMTIISRHISRIFVEQFHDSQDVKD